MGLLAIAAGPLVAVIGIISVFFVMRHKRVQEKSMYSARRGQIERKVRAARQRTLAPTSKHAGKEGEAPAGQIFAAPGMEAKTAVPTATWGSPVAGPAQAPPPPPAAEMTWDVGPVAPSAPAPPPPPFTPSAPAYTPPPPSEPAYSPPPPAPAEEWAPAAPQPVEPRRGEPTAAPIVPQVTTPARRNQRRTRSVRNRLRERRGSSHLASCLAMKPAKRSRRRARRSRSLNTQCSDLGS